MKETQFLNPLKVQNFKDTIPKFEPYWKKRCDVALKHGLWIAWPKCQVTCPNDVVLWTRLQYCNMVLSENVSRGVRYCITDALNNQSLTNLSNTLAIRIHQFPADPVEGQMSKNFWKHQHDFREPQTKY